MYFDEMIGMRKREREKPDVNKTEVVQFVKMKKKTNRVYGKGNKYHIINF